ncbi:MAG: PQQ-binding-like beta-propeller repeat protein [Myxococcota bacterium]
MNVILPTASTWPRWITALAAMFFVSTAYAQTSDYRGPMEFQEHCASCHESPAPGANIPTRAQLKAMPASKIYESMTTGKMSMNARGLLDDQKRRIAEWLSGRPVTDVDRSIAAMSNACPAGAKLGNPLVGAHWRGWSPDPTTSARFQSAEAAGLNAADVPNLKLKWAFGLPGAASLRSQPIVGSGWLWVGSDNSMVYALDAETGCVHWSFETERPVISSIAIGPMAGSEGRYVAYFGDFGANVYAVDAETGKLLWTTRVDDHHAAAVSGSVVLDPEGKRLIVPIGSWEEVMSTSPSYECCTSRGGVAVLDAKTGSQIWKAPTLALEAKPTWKNASGVQQYGPSGAGVWSSPTIDLKRNAVYVGTANAYTPVPDGGASDAIVAFDLSSGERLWSQQLLDDDADIYTCGSTLEEIQKNCPGTEVGPNDDIGAPPILHTLSDGRQILVASQESRRITVLDPDRKGAVIWRGVPSDRTTAFSGNLGPADDGEFLYVPLAYAIEQVAESIEGISGDGGVVALDPETGRRVWTAAIPKPTDCEDPDLSMCSSANQGAITAIPGVVFTGSTDGTMRAYSTKDGSILWTYSTHHPFETINGIKAHGGSIGGPGPTVVGGMVYFGSGYSILGTTPGNVLLAFEVDSGAAQSENMDQ